MPGFYNQSGGNDSDATGCDLEGAVRSDALAKFHSCLYAKDALESPDVLFWAMRLAMGSNTHRTRQTFYPQTRLSTTFDVVTQSITISLAAAKSLAVLAVVAPRATTFWTDSLSRSITIS